MVVFKSTTKLDIATFMKVLSNEIMNDDKDTMIAAVQPTWAVFDFISNRNLH
jgi:hypothetical protein